MAFPSKGALLVVPLLAVLMLTHGCVSYRLTKVEIGQPVAPGVAERLEEGETTLTQALALLGAPDRVVGLKDQNLLFYRRSISYENSLSVSVPVTDFVVFNSAEVSAEGGLVRFDILALFFSPRWILEKAVMERGSEAPYFRTLLGRE